MSKPKFKRPRTKLELDALEVAGLWKAISESKRVAESNQKITLDVILKIHRVIFEMADPEIAGRFRSYGEDVKKLKYIEPLPGGPKIQELMYQFGRDFDIRLSTIPIRPKLVTKTQKKKRVNQIVDLATWAQYQIAYIHPFCNGNGRMARLMTNMVLKRFGFHPSQVKIEGEDKTRYLDALGQIDLYGDHEPLKILILKNIMENVKKEQALRTKLKNKR